MYTYITYMPDTVLSFLYLSSHLILTVFYKVVLLSPPSYRCEIDKEVNVNYLQSYM